MRIFNVRLAAILLGITVVLGVGVRFLHSYQVRSNALFFLNASQSAEERAATAEKNKDSALNEKSLKEAIRHLRSYVTLVPTNYEAMEHLGILSADQAQEGDDVKDRQMFWQAYGLLENTVRLSPDRIEGRRRLVKMSMITGQYQAAKDHLERFLLIKFPKDPELLEQLGQCEAGLFKYDLAVKALKKSIANGPHQLTAYVKLAELLRYRLSKPEEADQWIDYLVKVNPNSAKAHYHRSCYLASPAVHRNDESLEEASKALELAPDDADILFRAAVCNLAKNRYDKARECLTHGVKVHPTNVRMYKLLSDVEMHAGDRNKAIAVLQNGVKATDRNPLLMWHVANLLIEANKLDESRLTLDELRKKSFAKPMIEFVNARLELAQQHWWNALEGFENVRGSMMVIEPQLIAPYSVKQIDVWIAVCYGQLGNREQQEQALQRALKADPSFRPARQALAELLGRQGDVDVSLKEYLELFSRHQLSSAGALQMVRLVFAKTRKQPPSQRNWKEVEKILDAVEKTMPNSPDILVLRAKMLSLRDRAADAEKLLLAACEKDPKQGAFWEALIALAESEKDLKKAQKLLEESGKALGDTVEQRLLRAQYFVRHEGKNASKMLRKLTENADHFSETDRARLWSGLIGAALQVGDAEQVGVLSQKIADKQPNNAPVRYLLLEKAIAVGDEAAIKHALKEVETVASQGHYWYYGQAMLLSLQARNRKDAGPLLEKALEYLAKARESRKDWAQVPLAEAQIYGQQGRPDLTLRALQEAIELGERNPQAIQQTIALLFQSRRYADADSLLRKLESEQESLSPKLRQLYAESALHQDDPKRALKNARKAVSPDSGDCREQMWLGQMLGILGSQAQARGQTAEAKELIEDAEKALRRAVELEPKLPVVWVSLVQFLSRIGKDDKAKAAIEQARTSIAAKDAPLAIAQCLEIVNESDAAKTEYEAALKAAPQDMITVRTVADFYRRAGKLLPAEALLQKILDGKLQTKDSDLAWARRQLAMILAARGDYPGLQKAQAMIETNLASPEASNEDRQLKARLMAADPTKGKREEAIPIWKQVLQDPSATPEDRLFLVRAYLNAGNWIEASNLLRGLVATNDKDPRFLALYISELLKHNEISSAETYCTRLEEIAPAWFPTVTLRADLLCAADQAHDAFGILKDFVDNVDAIPRERGVRLRLVSDKLAEIGRHMTKPEQASVAAECVALAESLLRTFVKENPGQELVLAVFLGEHGKVDESLDILDDVLQSSKVDDFARACSLVIEAGKCDKKQMQRMSKTIESAMKKFKRVTSLLLSLAELRTYQARYSESIDIYREAIAKTPDNSVALNNLAVLQALQGIDLDESLKLVNQAIEIAGPLGPMLDSRGTVYIAMNNSEKAIEDLTASVNDQDAPPRLFHLAQAYALAGDNAKARTTMDKALKKGLTKESLQPLEWPALEKLRQLPR